MSSDGRAVRGYPRGMNPSTQAIANNLFAQALPYILQTLGALGIAVITWVKLLEAKHIKNATLLAIVQRATDAAAAVVGEVQQTVVDRIQHVGVPLTAAQVKEVDAAALAKLKEHLGHEGIAELESVIDPATLDAKLVTWLQAAVSNMNTAKSAPSDVNNTGIHVSPDAGVAP